MDPNVNLEEQEYLFKLSIGGDHVRAKDMPRMRELRAALTGWLAKGGFAPNWACYPTAAKYFRAQILKNVTTTANLARAIHGN